VILVSVLVIVAGRVNVNYYALTPGDAQPIDPLVKVPPSKAHPIRGQILLTDVYLTQLTLLSYLPNLWDSNAQVVPSSELLDPYTPADQLTDQGYLQMAQSQSFAKAAAFTRLGYKVPVRNVGALISAVTPGTPAASTLSVGEVITAVGPTPTKTSCDVITALHTYVPGQVAQLSVQQVQFTDSGTPIWGRVVTEHVRLAKAPPGRPASGCPGVVGPSKVELGVEIPLTQQDFTYPFPVAVDTSQIGGPSAGLAMTLGIIDKLSSGHLTGGRKIAATGTIDPLGNVGDVGGVPQKTVAVEEAGATVFFVPGDEYHEALSKDVPSLHIYPVSTLDQALGILHRLGGTVPAAS